MTCVGCCVEEVWRMQEGLECQLCRDWSDGPCSDSYSPACWYSGSVLSSLLTVRELRSSSTRLCGVCSFSCVCAAFLAEPRLFLLSKISSVNAACLGQAHSRKGVVLPGYRNIYTHAQKKIPLWKKAIDACACFYLWPPPLGAVRTCETQKWKEEEANNRNTTVEVTVHKTEPVQF